MNDKFDAFQARQYFDFMAINMDDLNESFFDSGTENDSRPIMPEANGEMDDNETDNFFSPLNPDAETDQTSPSPRVFYSARRSLSMNDLLRLPAQNLRTSNTNNQPRPRSALGSSSTLNKLALQDHINRLSRPKRENSYSSNMTLAEAVNKFQSGTPERFRSKAVSRFVNKVPTVGRAPIFATDGRARPVMAISQEEQERREAEEMKKYKIKANPVNKRMLNGPLKAQVAVKKPVTTVEPFHLTEVKKSQVVEIPEQRNFKAQPVPKSLSHPFKPERSSQPLTQGQGPSCSKRMSSAAVTTAPAANPTLPYKPTKTQPVPFSFERRDQQLMKKKEEYISKVLEEERKAREFRAKPPPKTILRSRDSNQDLTVKTVSSESMKRSTDELQSITAFKAKPATVLNLKPFEPKKGDHPVTQFAAFNFSTDQRLEKRHIFAAKLKEKEDHDEALRRKQEEELKAKEEFELAQIRKQTEYKAQPIKKYKEIKIELPHKMTEPVSPKFHTDRVRNKENIE